MKSNSEMQRILAHKILCDGVEHRLSVLEISDDAMSAKITPFTHETAATRFVDGTVVVERNSRGCYEVKVEPSNLG